MGLVETFQRKAAKLGLFPKLIRLLPIFSLITTIISIILLLILPLDGQYRRTYISENALMPSQAYSYFRESEWNILRGYRTQLQSFSNNSNFEDISNQFAQKITTSEERFRTIESWLNEFGVKTSIYRNNATGDTLYGILHAPRGDGTEAMALCVPWKNSNGNLNIGGTALGIALTRYFSRWPIWSKNIVIVFSENPKQALRAWVEAYHTSLDLTGGSIEAAIVLDYPSVNDFFDYTEIHYNGLNGELPNLDLVNIAVSITQHEGMKVSLHNLLKDEVDENNYWSRLKLILLGIKDSTLAGVRKVHGNEAFSGWRIQSITLKACGDSGNIDITTFGRITEAMFRSVNNLLEKFHQSFFFYILLTPKNFVSISSYLPSAVLLSIAYALASINSILNTNISFNSLLAFPMTLVQIVSIHDKTSMSKIQIKNMLFLLVSNPFISILIFTTIFESENFKGLEVFPALISAWKDLNCWSWFILCVSWWPTWLLTVFSTMTTIPIPIVTNDSEDIEIKKDK
ncbi:hypothetical protein RI543_001370 [Arxiozyma heterogenica]|uniref:GPI transamidase component GAA1 n=1 Tax=Arxiozyma heterogenica TaxID=278026 RepID=A0AAN7WI89_9SACH|nr:hypothetical protein RI543_001370 [Kazachstania heterogenica]